MKKDYIKPEMSRVELETGVEVMLEGSTGGIVEGNPEEIMAKPNSDFAAWDDEEDDEL